MSPHDPNQCTKAFRTAIQERMQLLFIKFRCLYIRVRENLVNVVRSSRGVACLKFNVGNCGDVFNTFMKKKIKKSAFTYSVDPDETPQNAASHQCLRYLAC